ncbi:hypothetical protein FHG87_012116 [Trinorchestia longiramus]|nr:hypothetical protein FHG87_012116 [Trinorchestia longiramus]
MSGSKAIDTWFKIALAYSAEDLTVSRSAAPSSCVTSTGTTKQNFICATATASVSPTLSWRVCVCACVVCDCFSYHRYANLNFAWYPHLSLSTGLVSGHMNLLLL